MRAFLIVVAAVSLSSSAFARTAHVDPEEGADRALAPVLAPIALPEEPTFQPGLTRDEMIDACAKELADFLKHKFPDSVELKGRAATCIVPEVMGEGS
jgi:hypothetical protein